MSYEATVTGWKTPRAVDWNQLRDALSAYLRGIIATFSLKNPDVIVYGIVLKPGQNWEFSVYLNSEEGYASMPDRFRAQCVKWEPKTDEELLAILGRWYFDAWKYELYEFQCGPEGNALNDLHYELFGRLNDADPAQGEAIDLSAHFLAACAEATVILERSAEIQALRRTSDFTIRLFDANTHEWNTDPVMAQARKRLGET